MPKVERVLNSDSYGIADSLCMNKKNCHLRFQAHRLQLYAGWNPRGINLGRHECLPRTAAKNAQKTDLIKHLLIVWRRCNVLIPTGFHARSLMSSDAGEINVMLVVLQL